eukprot:symbB.v1.2.025507.t1/scaffold2452.1/size150514/8
MLAYFGRLSKVAGVCAGGLVLYDASNRDWSVQHTKATAAKQYVLSFLLKLWGRYQLNQLCRDAQRGDEVQKHLLAEILRRHQDSPYAFQNGLQGDAFDTHPLTEPGHDLNGALGKELSTHEASKCFLQRGVLPAFAVLSYCFPSIVEELQRMTVLPSTSDEPLVALLGDALRERLQWLGSFLCTSPMAAYDLKTEADRRYAHTLFSMKDRSLNMIQAGSAKFASDTLLETAHKHRRHLVQDLRNGHLWDRRLPEEVPQPELRQALDFALKGPDGKRSLEVEKLLKHGVAGMPAGAKDLWPHLQVVVVTSTNDEGKTTLGDLPVFSPFYCSSKAFGHLGVNIFPEEPFGEWTYLLDPGSMFFELLPKGSSSKFAIPAWEAEVGACYELVVTSSGPLAKTFSSRRHAARSKWSPSTSRYASVAMSVDDLGLSSDVGPQDSENSEGDFKEYAKSLGIDDEDGDLLWVAKEAFQAPLPSGWSEHLDPEGRVYFFSQVTQQSSWSHPMDDVFRELIELIKSVRRLDPPEASVMDAVQSHLQSSHDRATAALEGWSGPYMAEDGEYFCNFQQGVSTWHNPVQEWQTELAVRQQVLHRCLLSGFAKDRRSQTYCQPCRCTWQGLVVIRRLHHLHHRRPDLMQPAFLHVPFLLPLVAEGLPFVVARLLVPATRPSPRLEQCKVACQADRRVVGAWMKRPPTRPSGSWRSNQRRPGKLTIYFSMEA